MNHNNTCTQTLYSTARMEAISASVEQSIRQYDGEKEMKEIDETRAGVKGLADSGMLKIPKVFINQPEKSCKADGVNLQVPVIDFAGLESSGVRRMEIVEEIRKASENWGFFQMINHGISFSVLDGMLKGVRRFHEQPSEAKLELYSLASTRSVRFYNNESFLKSKDWRDTLSVQFLDDTLVDPDMLSPTCRFEVEEYMKWVIKLKETLAELLSEALGLNKNYLSDKEYMTSGSLLCHYYPACPQPEMTHGIIPHSDLPFLTILLQDNVGGLQVHHQNQWVDLKPLQGSLIANIGDLMQLITNDKFNSVKHRVLATSVKSRVSVACFFRQSTRIISRPIGPIEELQGPPLYKKVIFADYVARYKSDRKDCTGTLAHFKQ
ncbi:unnamed protein product [Ilex paraguariensis]|uniref:Fe2OG dioxygenase domain-containing protein n=1 Tax=Ilex paraguariensis TaxID=185542 RepID=A0ABC8SXA3_9AQUA